MCSVVVGRFAMLSHVNNYTNFVQKSCANRKI
jgi:hypothetical protein